MQYEGLTGVIVNYIDQRRQQKCEPIEKKRDKALKEASSDTEKAQVDLAFAAELQQIEQQFVVQNWLSDAAVRAKQISLATHALKYTHGDAKGSSVLSLEHNPDASYLTTCTLPNLAIDAVGNAAALDVAKLLQQEFAGRSLAEALNEGDNSALQPLSENADQLVEWTQGLQAALADKKLSSHTLSKQLYFPVADGEYHMISPLFASAMAQQFNEKLRTLRFSDESKQIREARKAGKYHISLDIRFLDTAVQYFGGSKPQNISQLNSQRGGQTYLLNCSPPSWQSTLKPPTNRKSIFDKGEVDRRGWRDLQELAHYLKSVQERESTLAIRRTVAGYVNTLIDVLLNYAAEIQAMTEQSGWSQSDCKLNIHEKLWLDPGCSAELFQQQRVSIDWQKQICEAFGLWLNNSLNRALRKEGLVFGKVQQQHWAKLLAPRLRDYELTTEIFTVSPNQSEVLS